MQNEVITPAIFSFLKKLEKNNNRDWFTEHKKDFEVQKTDMNSFFTALSEDVKQNDEIERVKIFRIYRDVRFSKNKLPYKTHFGGSFARKKPELRGGYYLHIQPNNESFIATGFWEPSKEDLFRIRKEFEMDDSEMRDILNNKTFHALIKLAASIIK